MRLKLDIKKVWTPSIPRNRREKIYILETWCWYFLINYNVKVEAKVWSTFWTWRLFCHAVDLIQESNTWLHCAPSKAMFNFEEDEEEFEKGKVLFCEEKRTQLLHLLGLFLLRSKVFVVEAEKLFVVYDNQRSDKRLVTDTQFVLLHQSHRTNIH